MNQDKTTDKQLIAKIKQGEQMAFSTLVNRWKGRVFQYALRYSNDRFFAEEVMQRVFIQVYQKLDQLRDPDKFKWWMYKIISNECFSEGRKLKRNNELIQPSESLPDATDGRDPYYLYHRNERGKVVLMALQSIPVEQRQVIIMKEYDGMKFREIAEVLEESENTVKSRLYYGLKAMRNILMKHQWTKELYHG
jgi:RNA polymerase sigma-70 factor (ECF subfamily)